MELKENKEYVMTDLDGNLKTVKCIKVVKKYYKNKYTIYVIEDDITYDIDDVFIKVIGLREIP